MKTVDLHSHSYISDGSLSPSELAEYARKMNLSAFALTDHDSADGLKEAQEAADKSDIEFVPGIEFSAVINEQNFHLLGLFIDFQNNVLESELQAIKEERNNRNRVMLKKLNDLGLDISMEDVLKYSGKGIVSRVHFAKALLEKGITSSYKDGFDRFLRNDGPAYVKRNSIQAKKAIDLIHLCGGVAVLAHPLSYKLSDKNVDKLTKNLKDAGIDGIEVFYSTHSSAQTAFVKKLADKYSLLYSGGSDFHGESKPGLELGIGYGSLSVPYTVYEKLKRKACEYGAKKQKTYCSE